MTCTPQPTMVHHSLGALGAVHRAHRRDVRGGLPDQAVTIHATQAVGFYLIAAGLAGLALLWGAILLGRRRG